MKAVKKILGSVLILKLLMLSSMLSPSVIMAEKLKTVEGLIESVTNDSIAVRGIHYKFPKAVLLAPSGKKLSADYLKPGKKVELFFQDNKITSILIFEPMNE